jgi:hypothetical protein
LGDLRSEQSYPGPPTPQGLVPLYRLTLDVQVRTKLDWAGFRARKYNRDMLALTPAQPVAVSLKGISPSKVVSHGGSGRLESRAAYSTLG